MREQVLAVVVAAATFATVTGGIVGVGLAMSPASSAETAAILSPGRYERSAQSAIQAVFAPRLREADAAYSRKIASGARASAL